MGLIDILKGILESKKSNCHHEYPDKLVVADVLDRESKFLRVYFCQECNGYKWREVKGEAWVPSYLSDLKKNQYRIYSSFEEFSSFKKAPKQK